MPADQDRRAIKLKETTCTFYFLFPDAVIVDVVDTVAVAIDVAVEKAVRKSKFGKILNISK